MHSLFVRVAGVGLALFTLSSCSKGDTPTPGATTEAEQIFRYVDINPYGVIRLGAGFPDTSALGVQIRPGVYRLDRKDGRPIQLGDTRAILVALTPNHLVCAFHFLYLADKDFPAGVAEYEGTLGAATRTGADSADSHIELAVWQDSTTRLELRRSIAGTDTVVTALLADRSLASDGCAR